MRTTLALLALLLLLAPGCPSAGGDDDDSSAPSDDDDAAGDDDDASGDDDDATGDDDDATGDDDDATGDDDDATGDDDDATGDDDDATGDDDDSAPVDADGDTYDSNEDCDDNDATVYPSAPELCDGLDNDCDSVIPTEEDDFTGDGEPDCASGSCTATGMSWAMGAADASLGTVSASCDNCDAYDGDSVCTTLKPVLCVEDTGAANPGSFGNWAAANSAITAPVGGCQLNSASAADALCEGWFGAGWRMAEFHDGGGWSMTTSGSWSTSDRLWVGINNQVANCWQTDNDGDGVRTPADCDDDDDTVYPGATELCDGLDNDCDTVLPLEETDLTGDGTMDCAPTTGSGVDGMSWSHGSTDTSLGTVSVACDNCDAYAGDLSCDEARPVLCLLPSGATNPGSSLNWAGGELALTGDIGGWQLDSAGTADDLCQSWYGNGWRMAEFHDGGGWSMSGLGNWSTTERFWVHINNQPANCWN